MDCGRREQAEESRKARQHAAMCCGVTHRRVGYVQAQVLCTPQEVPGALAVGSPVLACWRGGAGMASWDAVQHLQDHERAGVKSCMHALQIPLCNGMPVSSYLVVQTRIHVPS